MVVFRLAPQVISLEARLVLQVYYCSATVLQVYYCSTTVVQARGQACTSAKACT